MPVVQPFETVTEGLFVLAAPGAMVPVTVWVWIEQVVPDTLFVSEQS
jgi:hypothetical protein